MVENALYPTLPQTALGCDPGAAYAGSNASKSQCRNSFSPSPCSFWMLRLMSTQISSRPRAMRANVLAPTLCRTSQMRCE
eukprot:2156576-Rhodomonas_salina.2